jgi:hypothetical protein
MRANAVDSVPTAVSPSAATLNSAAAFSIAVPRWPHPSPRPGGGRTAAMAALNCAWAQAAGNAEIVRCISLPIAVPLPLRRPAPDAALTAFADSPEASPAPASRRDKLGQAPATAPST